MQILYKLQFALILLITLSKVYSQQAGMPFIRNYLPQEFKASPQSWALAQDPRGVMYFGNNDGILEFDGVDWRLIKIPGVGPLAIDSLGRIFVGTDNDIGYLQPDRKGNFQYYSLKPKIPEIHREINICYRVFILGEEVVFQTDDKLYIYHHDKIKVITSNSDFQLSFFVHNRFYILKRGKGLLYLQNDSLRLIGDTKSFIEKKIVAMMPYRQNEVLVATSTKGIFVYSLESPAILRKSDEFNVVSNFISENEAYCGTPLTNGDFAVGTITGGVLVFDTNGKIKNVYNKSSGLQDNSVYWLYSDRNQQLWASLDNGISLIHNNLPFRYYSEKSGLNGGVNCLGYYNNHLYAGTGQYLHVRDQQGNFEPIKGTKSQNFQLYEARGILLLANTNGIFTINGKQAVQLANTSDISALAFCSLKGQPQYLLAGSTHGIYLLEYENSSWKLKHKIKGFNKPSYKIDSDKDGNIWVSTLLDINKLKITDDLDSIISCQLCTREHGLPSDYAMTFTLNSGEVVFCSEKGVYRYLNGKNKFESHPDFPILTGKVIPFLQEKNGDIWFEQLLENGNYEKGVLKFRDGKYIPYTTPFDKFSDISSGDCPFNICCVPGGSVYFGSGFGLLQYNPSVETDFNQPFNTLIRNVFSKDSLLFGGDKANSHAKEKSEGKEISYSQNNLIIHFASTFYEDAEKNMFSYRLIGSDTTWSVWTKDHKKEYTNLPEGKYVFEVKSKNQYQITGSTASFRFYILPPWYHTWWAYVLYFIMFITFVYFMMKLYAHQIGKQKAILEDIVRERTSLVLEQKKEIQENNEILTRTNNKLSETNTELKQTNDKLITTLDIVNNQKKQIEVTQKQITDQNNELKQYRNHLEELVEERTRELLLAKNKAEESDRLKTAFLQNMSHEIRTPMNGILGFLNFLKEPDLDDVSKSDYIDVINKSGERLLNTINAIIEISRIESNQIDVHNSEVDIMELMDFHLNFFKPQADEKGIALKLSAQIQGKKAIVESDKHILYSILTNLINNAIKFTEKGTIEFGNYLDKDLMIFFVKDTGTGIPADRLDAIFDRFVQADIKSTRGHEGSGLGLSIVKGHLEILNGTIWVESEPGKGSTFFFSVPYKPILKGITIIEMKKEQEPVSEKKLTILVAEDDENSYLYIKTVLKNMTVNLLHSTNGNETVRIFKENPDISLILMDIKMPELNGLDATRQIRQINCIVPIIAQTAYAMAEDKEKAIKAGCNDYIAKPINSKKLIQLIQKYTNNELTEKGNGE